MEIEVETKRKRKREEGEEEEGERQIFSSCHFELPLVLLTNYCRLIDSECVCRLSFVKILSPANKVDDHYYHLQSKVNRNEGDHFLVNC